MKYNSKKVCTIITILCLIIVISGNSLAHSGRTDSSGGHKDNQNKSGLGSYHYHCGGHPAHLHENGVCPYSSTPSSTSSSSKSTSTSNSKSSNSESITTSSSAKSTSVSVSEQKTIIKATGIEINESITTIKEGESIQLTATIIPENTEDKSITWSSNDEDIATVSSTGKVIALKAGTVNITTSTSNGKNDTITIIVEEVKKIEENNNTIEQIHSNELNNRTTNTTEDSDVINGIIGLGLIGGGSYLRYKKYKKSNK